MLRRMYTPPLLLRTVALLASAVMLVPGFIACSSRAPDPPNAEFLVATADSTFWVHSDAHGIRIRAVPMTLAHFGGRFHEVFIADLDRSFNDAVFTGERVYVRDLQSNDSALVYDDTAIVAMAVRHARAHPDATPLHPDEDRPTDPRISVTGETDVLEVRGAYALLEHRIAFETQAGDQHDTVHTAIDLRTSAAATQIDMSRDSAADDSNVVRALPRSWERNGYTLNARGAGDGAVSLTLRDKSRHSWPLLSVGDHPRVYWLDYPPIGAVARRALLRAFNSAAAYDEAVKYVKYVRPAKAIRRAVTRRT